RYLLRRSRYRNLEHAVLDARLRLIGDRALPQRNDAVERAVAALDTIDAVPLLFALLRALTRYRDRIVADLDDDVFGLDAGDAGADDQLAAALDHGDSRRPRHDRRRAGRLRAGRA